MSDVLQRIRDWLTTEGAAFREVHHEPTFTSEQSAAARGEPLEIGGKALLIKAGERFVLFVLSAARKFDSDAGAALCGVKKTRFASADELRELTGLVRGCVPPFGRPILPFDLFVDDSIAANPRIAFNAGSLTDSIVMLVADYLRIARPTVAKFSRDG